MKSFSDSGVKGFGFLLSGLGSMQIQESSYQVARAILTPCIALCSVRLRYPLIPFLSVASEDPTFQGTASFLVKEVTSLWEICRPMIGWFP